MTNILSVEDLIKNKVKIEKSDDKEIKATLNIPSIGGNIKLVYTKNDVLDFHESMSNVDKNLPKEKQEELYAQAGYDLIYTIVSEPNLKDEKLQKAYECQEPTDIVKKVFDDGEMKDIMDFAVEKAGLKSGKVVEVQDLKN